MNEDTTTSGAADLPDALLTIAREIEALKRECGMDPESSIAVQNGRYMAISYKVRALAAGHATAPQPVARDPLDEARRMFDAGWKAAALFCDREDVVADGIIGFGACPQFEAAFSAAHGIKGGQHGTDT